MTLHRSNQPHDPCSGYVPAPGGLAYDFEQIGRWPLDSGRSLVLVRHGVVACHAWPSVIEPAAHFSKWNLDPPCSLNSTIVEYLW